MKVVWKTFYFLFSLDFLECTSQFGKFICWFEWVSVECYCLYCCFIFILDLLLVIPYKISCSFLFWYEIMCMEFSGSQVFFLLHYSNFTIYYKLSSIISTYELQRYSLSDLIFFLYSSKRRHKKKIRRILDDAELGEETKRKIAIEKVRFSWDFVLPKLVCWSKLFIIIPTSVGTSGTPEVFARTVFCFVIWNELWRL